MSQLCYTCATRHNAESHQAQGPRMTHQMFSPDVLAHYQAAIGWTVANLDQISQQEGPEDLVGWFFRTLSDRVLHLRETGEISAPDAGVVLGLVELLADNVGQFRNL